MVQPPMWSQEQGRHTHTQPWQRETIAVSLALQLVRREYVPWRLTPVFHLQ